MSDLTKQAAKNLDASFNFRKIFGGLTGAIAESLDGVVFRGILEFADAKIPEEHRDIWESFLNALAGNYADFTEDVANKLNELIDIPGLNEAEEDVWISANVKALVTIIQMRKAAAEAEEVESEDAEEPTE